MGSMDWKMENAGQVLPREKENVWEDQTGNKDGTEYTKAEMIVSEPGFFNAGTIHGKSKKEYLWLLIFVAGLVTGTWFANFPAAGKIGVSGVWMEETVDKIVGYGGNVGAFIHILVKRGGIFIFLAGMTLLWRRSLLLYLSTAYFGFCFGTVISATTIACGLEGLWQLLVFLLPHYLLYIPAYILLLRWSGEKKSIRRKGFFKADLSELVMAVVMVIFGCVLECCVNPIWVRFFEALQ